MSGCPNNVFTVIIPILQWKLRNREVGLRNQRGQGHTVSGFKPKSDSKSRAYNPQTLLEPDAVLGENREAALSLASRNSSLEVETNAKADYDE